MLVQSTVRERLASDSFARHSTREGQRVAAGTASAQHDTQDHVKEAASGVYNVLVRNKQPRHRSK